MLSRWVFISSQNEQPVIFKCFRFSAAHVFSKIVCDFNIAKFYALLRESDNISENKIIKFRDNELNSFVCLPCFSHTNVCFSRFPSERARFPSSIFFWTWQQQHHFCMYWILALIELTFTLFLSICVLRCWIIVFF